MTTTIDVRTDMDSNPWDVNAAHVIPGTLKSIGFLRSSTAQGRGSAAMLVRLPDDQPIIVQAPWRIVHAAVLAIAASQTAAGVHVGSMTIGDRPKIVAICGSTRFRDEIAAANRELTLAGCIVLAPGVFGHSGDEMTAYDKVALDKLHFQKIAMADTVYVVNPGGYIGDSTRAEIAYAQRLNKPIKVLVDQPTA